MIAEGMFHSALAKVLVLLSFAMAGGGATSGGGSLGGSTPKTGPSVQAQR